MLNKDQSETIKKYTKIIIKLENGEWTISDFATESTNSIFSLYFSQETKPDRCRQKKR